MQSIRKWIEFSKISTFFFPKKSIFSKKKFEKVNIFDRNLWIFRLIICKTFKFYETYERRENFSEFSYFAKKFPVAAGEIISVGTLGPLKDYQALPAGGPGAKAPRTVAKFHFLKRFKVFENEFISQ